MIGNTTTVVRVRRNPEGHDVYGDLIASVDVRTVIKGAAVEPRVAKGQRAAGDFTDRGRQGVFAVMALYLPYGTDVLHSDRFEVDGVMFEVDGVANSWRSPWTRWKAGVEVALRRAEG